MRHVLDQEFDVEDAECGMPAGSAPLGRRERVETAGESIAIGQKTLDLPVAGTGRDQGRKRGIVLRRIGLEGGRFGSSIASMRPSNICCTTHK